MIKTSARSTNCAIHVSGVVEGVEGHRGLCRGVVLPLGPQEL